MSKNNKKSKESRLKKISIKRKILIGFEVFFAVIVLIAAGVLFIPSVKAFAIQTITSSSIGKYWIKYYGKESYNNSIYDFEFDDTKIETNDMEYNYSTEYTNFIIFGIDSRTSQFDGGTNSDSMLIVSLHNTTGEVKIASIYRDNYMRVYRPDGDYFYTKVNAAYSVGGAEGAINTLNKNLDL
ncbi:MAG: LCP family protein, partial [Lachnospiraceae bacterium]|nr:LCP family protein [Lachnospiraceae bacterium]